MFNRCYAAAILFASKINENNDINNI
jgi:hypothetical protein